MLDLDSMTLLGTSVGIASGLGLISTGLDFLNYHELTLQERKKDYNAQEKCRPHKTYMIENPTW